MDRNDSLYPCCSLNSLLLLLHITNSRFLLWQKQNLPSVPRTPSSGYISSVPHLHCHLPGMPDIVRHSHNKVLRHKVLPYLRLVLFHLLHYYTYIPPIHHIPDTVHNLSCRPLLLCNCVGNLLFQ